MKNRFSRIFCIFLCFALIMSLSACSESVPKSNTASDDTEPLQYNLHISVDFEENLIFSTYDVYLEIDDHKKKMKHGNDYELDYQLEPGTYTLTFRSAEDDSIFKAVELNIQGDTRAKYKISCHYDKISVTTKSVETPGAVKENQAMLPLSSSTCKGKDYQEVEQSFSDAGFTNISTNILYEIVWGFTPEGEVEKVSVNGNTKFTKGEIFDKNAEIIITYHMDEDKDPAKETTRNETQPENNLTSYPVDYMGAQAFESALNNGIDVNGKTVAFKVNAYKPDSVLGINYWAGEHLNFISEYEIAVNEGDTIVGLVTKKPSKILGSWEIAFKIIEINGIPHEEASTETTPADVTESIDTTLPETNSNYEKAFVRKLGSYSLYYMFDTDHNSVIYFGTNDTYVEYGTYSGSLSSGVTITWSHGEWTEKFVNSEGSRYATLTDGNGYKWDYEVCNVDTAQELLDTFQTHEQTENSNIPTASPTTESTHSHSFGAATCTAPKTCSCGATEGEAPGHVWKSPTCSDPKTCTVCGTTSGLTAGHTFYNGYCTSCGKTDPDYIFESMVWIPTNGGTKYHTRAGCSNMENPEEVTKSEAESRGFTPCKRCH